GQRSLFFIDRAGLRLCPELHRISDPSRTVWNRHGRGMGSRRVTGDGSRSAAVARHSQRRPAKRLFDWQLAGCRGGALCSAGLGLAAHVLARRIARASRALYKDQGAGVRGVATAPRRLDGRGAAHGGFAMETLRVSCGADDLHDVFVPWHAGPLSGFSEGSAPAAPRAGCEYRDDLYRGSGGGSDHFWPSLAGAGPAQGNDVRVGVVAGDYPLLGVWLEHSLVDCRG